jgi:MoxR-like ATPase
MFHIRVGYPTEDEELEIVRRTTADIETHIEPRLTADEIVSLSHIVRRVPIADHVARYALQLARLSRSSESEAPDFVRQYVRWGAGPRASQYMVVGAKARAVMHGRTFVNHEDIRAVAAPVLRHRIKTNFAADAEGITADEIVRRLIATVRSNQEHENERDRGHLASVLRAADAG